MVSLTIYNHAERVGAEMFLLESKGPHNIECVWCKCKSQFVKDAGHNMDHVNIDLIHLMRRSTRSSQIVQETSCLSKTTEVG